jgi:GNAT superfamily N-acetyltransferase
MEIREANSDDIKWVGLLWLSMTNEFEPENTPNIDWWTERMKMLLDTGAYYLFIAKEDGQTIGYIDFMIINEPSDGKIHAIGQQLFVALPYRNTSAAGRLWKAAYKKAKELGAAVMDATAYRETRHFWEKRGFQFYCYSLRKEVRLCQ